MVGFGSTIANWSKSVDEPFTETLAAVDRAIKMVTEGAVVGYNGEIVQLKADTLCIHGDNPAAPRIAAAVTEALRGQGVEIKPMASLTLTADHRVLDGASAARFLATIQAVLEHPGLLLG